MNKHRQFTTASKAYIEKYICTYMYTQAVLCITCTYSTCTYTYMYMYVCMRVYCKNSISAHSSESTNKANLILFGICTCTYM